MNNKLQQFNALLNEGISHEDLSDVLHNRLQFRYPDVIDKYGYDAVDNAVSDVASFHAGAEELGSSDISIMLKEIIKQLESQQGVAEGSVYKKDQDLSDVSTQELEAFVKKHWFGGIPTYGQGESVKRAMRELRRRQKQGVAEDADPCWDNYKQIGMKMKGGKKVPNCVPKEGVEEDRHAEHAWRDAVQTGKALAQQAPAKYFLKDRATGKVLGQFNSAPDAVRGAQRFGGNEKCKVEIMREDGVLEAYDDFRNKERTQGEQEPTGIFTVLLNGKPWIEGSSNEMFTAAERVARKYPMKKVQVRWPNGAINTVGGQVNELSTNKLAQYKTAASKDASAADKAGDFKRGDKRFSGIVKATKKQFDNDAKQVKESSIMRGINSAQLDEGWKSALAGAALAGMAALGGGQAHAAPVDNMSTQYLQSVVSGEAGRPMVSVDAARQELQARANGKQQNVAPETKPQADQSAPRGANLKPEVLQQLKAGTYKGWAPRLSPEEIDAAIAYQQGNQ